MGPERRRSSKRLSTNKSTTLVESRTSQSTSRRETESEFHSFRSSFIDSSFLEPESFDLSGHPSELLPKTDYTYARTGSYSPRHLHDKYKNPNMSRHSIHDSVTPPTSMLEMSDSDSDALLESETETYSRIVTEPGMVLRSGVKLTRQQRLEAERLARQQRSTPSTASSQGTEGRLSSLRHRDTLDGDSRHVTTTTTVTRTMYEFGDDQDDSSLQYGSRSQSKRAALQSREDRLRQSEQERSDSEEERTASRKLQQEGSVRLQYLYDLDQTDYSDVEDIDLSLRGDRFSEDQGLFSRLFQFIKTTVTSIITTTTTTTTTTETDVTDSSSSEGRALLAERKGFAATFFKFILTVITTTAVYSWKAVSLVATPVWTYIVAPIISPSQQRVGWLEEKITTIFGYFVLLDAWLLSRFSRACCCACLPLLLLLPLLFAGGHYYLHRTQEPTVFIPQGDTQINLYQEVKQILVQLKAQEKRGWLTRSEIEGLVQGMLDPSVDSLRLSLTQIMESSSNEKGTLRQVTGTQDDVNQKIAAMETQMALLLEKTKEKAVDTISLYSELKPVLVEQGWLTGDQVQDLVNNMITLQVEALRLDLLAITKQGTTEQDSLKASQEDVRSRLVAMETQIAQLLDMARTKDLDGDVRRIVLALKTEDKYKWLDQGEVEALVQGLLASQMDALRLSLLDTSTRSEEDQAGAKLSKEAGQRLDTVERQLAVLVNTEQSRDLQREVQQIMLDIRKGETGGWLSQTEVESVVQGLLTPQLQALQTSLASMASQRSSDQETMTGSQAELRQRLDSLETQVTGLVKQAKTQNLHTEVQAILVALQEEGKQDWLTRSQIETLVQGLLAAQMDALRLSLQVSAKDSNQDQEGTVKEDARQRLDLVEKQIAAFLDNTPQLTDSDLSYLREQLMGTIHTVRDSLEGKLQAEQARWEERLSSERSAWEAKMASMEVTISDLRGLIESSQSTNVELAALTKKCCRDETALLATIEAEVKRVLAESGRTGVSQGTAEDVKGIIDAALLKYTADRTGMPDYALESTGGSIINIRCSKTYTRRSATVKIWGLPIYYVVNGPRTVIQPEVLPGNCWPFQGASGFLVIQLAVPVLPTSFTLEHITKEQSIYGDLGSAPKNFSVIGLKAESDTTGLIFGNYTYNVDGPPMQHFDVQVKNPGIFLFIELRVHDNYGNKEYTCLYRFRVHGIPQKQPEIH